MVSRWIIRWPKLFDGWVIADKVLGFHYRRYIGTGFGLGGLKARGDGYGDGAVSGYGDTGGGGVGHGLSGDERWGNGKGDSPEGEDGNGGMEL